MESPNTIKKQCCITGCSKPGKFQPMIRVRDPRTSELEQFPGCEFFMQCLICEHHKFQLNLGAVMTHKLWSHISGAFKSLRGVEPSHKDCSLEYKCEDSVITLFGKGFAKDGK